MLRFKYENGKEIFPVDILYSLYLFFGKLLIYLLDYIFDSL